MVWVRMGCDEKRYDLTSNTSDEGILPNRWYRLAVTFDGKTLNIYLNGRLAASKEAAAKQPRSYNHILIGSTGDGYGYGFDGVITQVRMFDCALTPDKITSLQLEE